MQDLSPAINIHKDTAKMKQKENYCIWMQGGFLEKAVRFYDSF